LKLEFHNDVGAEEQKEGAEKMIMAGGCCVIRPKTITVAAEARSRKREMPHNSHRFSTGSSS
jgi:hypothetical protein